MGYIGQERSERSQEAIDNGLLTFSQLEAWQKRAVKAGAIFACEWHHTGKYYTKTEYYNPFDFKYLKKSDFPVQKNTEVKVYAMECTYDVWGGTRKHPKLVDTVYDAIIFSPTKSQQCANKYRSVKFFFSEEELEVHQLTRRKHEIVSLLKGKRVSTLKVARFDELNQFESLVQEEENRLQLEGFLSLDAVEKQEREINWRLREIPKACKERAEERSALVVEYNKVVAIRHGNIPGLIDLEAVKKEVCKLLSAKNEKELLEERKEIFDNHVSIIEKRKELKRLNSSLEKLKKSIGDE